MVRGERIPILPTLQVAGFPEVSVIGDLAFLEQDGVGLPMIAPVAIQQGRAVAQSIVRQMHGDPPVPFRYRDPGSMVTIGRNAAVAHVSGRRFTGFPAWTLWLGVHLFNLIGYRNRILVLVNWAWDYLFFERAVRLIIPSPCANTDATDSLPAVDCCIEEMPGGSN
jgi:NADH dehydrogenase